MPYDQEYVPLFVALVAGLCGLGLVPRCAAEDRSSGRRLERILDLIAECPRSIHDVSRVGLGPSGYPRFNMPFELGLAVGWGAFNASPHEWWVLDHDRSQSAEKLSDLNGTDPSFHGNDPAQILTALLDIFHRQDHPPTFTQLDVVRQGLDARLAAILAKSNSRNPFAPAPFRDLLLEATALVDETIGTRR